MDGYHVHTEALRAYSATLRKASQRVSAVMSKLGTIHVPADAFGKLPDAEGLASAYSEHHDADIQDCKDLRDILDDTADGMATTADHYDDNESHTDSSMKGIRP
ncbi:type VII secretion target [Streptomyces lydicus]